MSDLFAALAEQLRELEADHSRRTLRPVRSIDAAVIRRGGKELINFGSNDYLGLAGRPTPKNDAAQGAGASPLICGYTELHDELCRRIAEFEQTEAAVLFAGGYAACSGTVATLARAGDLILSDRLNHASLIDGCRLSAARRIVYPHADVAAVAELLQRHRGEYRNVWVITDGVFGMDGNVAPLAELCDLAERFAASLIVDEAHATGVLGEDGSGSCSHCGVKSRVPIRIGTLSKAIGAHGGFVAGPKTVIDYLVNFCRPLIFSTAAPPVVIAAAIAGIEAIQTDSRRRDRVQQLARRVREHLADPAGEDGHGADGDDIVPIIPVHCGTNAAALEAAACAEAHGLFIPAIRPPTVPEGTARLRISLSAAHSDEQIERLIAFCRGRGLAPSRQNQS